MTTNCHHAARILLGLATIDDVPESQQTSVLWLVRRCGPDCEATEPVEVVVGMMAKAERMRRRMLEMERELENRDLRELADMTQLEYQLGVDG